MKESKVKTHNWTLIRKTGIAMQHPTMHSFTVHGKMGRLRKLMFLPPSPMPKGKRKAKKLTSQEMETERY